MKYKAILSLELEFPVWLLCEIPAESFFSHYKCETIYLMRNQIKDINDVKQITEEYMNYYINERPQKALGGLSPKDYRQNKLAA